MSAHRFAPLLLAALALSCGGGHRLPRSERHRPPAPPIKLTILGVNDFHGATEEKTVMLETSGGVQAAVHVGGAAMLAGYIEAVRALDPDATLLLSAGDMWQGTLESNTFEGRPVALLDDALGYDAAAVGNHEFDYGPAGSISLAEPGDPPGVRYGALLARMRDLKFPLLAANVRATEPGVPAFKPWILVERAGLKIAIVGLSTEETPQTTQPPNVVGLAFDPPGPALAKAAAEARAAGADLVIATAHLGGECRRGSDPHDPSACRKDEEVMRTIDALPPGAVDAFVAGHTHQFMANYVDGVPVIESGAHGVAFGRIVLTVDPTTRKVLSSEILPPQPICRDVLADTGSCVQPEPPSSARAKVVPATFLGSAILPDPELDRMLAPFRQEVAAKKAQPLAAAARAVREARGRESEIGDLVTDEMLAATKREADVPDADFALQNTGGLRTGLPAGPITYGALYEVLPFDNVLATMQLTGAQLEDLFTTVVRTGRVMQVSAGLRVDICGEGAAASVTLHDAASGARLDARRKYRVVWNDFLANGGDGTKSALVGIDSQSHGGRLLRDAVAEGLALRKAPINSASEPLVDPKKPRTRFLPASSCR